MAIPDDFKLGDHEFGGRKRELLISRSEGPPVVIMHEIFGVTESLIHFCRMISGAGFRTYTPVLFGSASPKSGVFDKGLRAVDFLCVSAQFRAFQSGDPGPWASWLRDLAEKLATPDHKGVGVIGLCLTGNFALSMAMSSKVLAAVMGEPSLPIGNGKDIHVSDDELKAVRARIANERFEVRGYRYETDWICPRARFTALEGALGAGFKGTNLPARERLHSVFTEHLRDKNNNLRHDKVEEVIGYLSARLR